MTTMLQQHLIRAETRGPAIGNEIQPVGVLALVRRLASRGDIA